MLLVASGEASTGQTALQLLQGADPWQYAAAALWVYASMVPVLKGARHEAFGGWHRRTRACAQTRPRTRACEREGGHAGGPAAAADMASD